MLEKFRHMVLLKDFYGPLLTEKQQNVMSLYYENDWSLSEIAQNMGISRQGVYDLVKRSESALEEYEERLGLVQKFNNTRQELEEIYSILNKPGKIGRDEIDKAASILRRITESV